MGESSAAKLCDAMEKYNSRSRVRVALRLLVVSLAWFIVPAAILWGFGAEPGQAVRYACGPYLLVGLLGLAVVSTMNAFAKTITDGIVESMKEDQS